MERVAVEGAELSAMVLGAASGPPVVLLHGLVTGSMASWYSAVALPLSATHRVVLYDQRGHGGSTLPPTGFDLESQTRDLAQILVHTGFSTSPVDLVGHSMGALIALRFALRNPRSVRRLVLADAPMPACAHVAPSLRALAREPGLALRALHGRRRDRLHQRIASLTGDTTLLHDVSAMQAEPDEALARYGGYVKLIYGRHSPCLSAGRHLLAVLPCATLDILEAGHDLPEEAASELTQSVARFLSVGEAGARKNHSDAQVLS
jgi:pimeloyl-ACP methyl ester carboxylesterase